MWLPTAAIVRLGRAAVKERWVEVTPLRSRGDLNRPFT